MKKTILILLALTVAVMSGGCSKTKIRSVKSIKKSGVLNVYAYQAGKPFVWQDSGILSGVEIDAVNELAARLQVVPVFNTGDKAAVYAAIQSGEADIGVGMFIASTAAGNIVSFTSPTGTEGVFAVRRNAPGSINTDTAGVLREKTIAVVSSSASEYALIDLGVGAESVQAYASAAEAAQAVLAGERDIFVCGEYTADDVVSTSNGELAAEYITNAKPTEFSAIVARGNDDLLAAANAVIKAMQE